VYGRRIKGRELHFEPSGVLMHGSIVMQDKETDSFWPIMQGKAVYGELKGTALEELPVSVKARWGDWVREHPDTLVWTVGGREHMDANPLQPYLGSSYGFKGLLATDTRIASKEPVFAFTMGGHAYAAPAAVLEGGRTFAVEGTSLFLYRLPGGELNDPTRAFSSSTGFARTGEAWIDKATGARFDPARGVFGGKEAPRRLSGFDTFWYIWSLNHPDTELLGADH